MKLKFLSKGNSQRLLIFFAGWGMDWRPFASLSRPFYDLAVAYDYSDRTEIGNLETYDEIMVLAWSFGVIAADKFIRTHNNLPITARIAVNGTLHPVDDELGIPKAIFYGTLEGLSEKSLAKFRLRMCGSARALTEFMAHPPLRTIESLKSELQAIEAMETGSAVWDMAFVSATDRIIPPANQRRQWELHSVRVREIEGAHMPDFNTIIENAVYDKSLVAARFSKAEVTYDDNATVQTSAALQLSEQWRRFAPGNIRSMIEVGAGTGLFTRAYTQWLHPERLELWDISSISGNLPGTHIVCDAETNIRCLKDGAVDAIASASTVQWLSSLRTFLKQCGRATSTRGWLAFSTFGDKNFHELGPARYPALPDIRRWVEESGFEIMASEEAMKECRFSTPQELLQHLKLTGVNALSPARGPLSGALSIVRGGLTTLTYHTIIVIARKKC